MPRTPNRFGGGARTNANGLYFEQTISLDAALIDAGYIIRGVEVFNENSQIGLSVQKHDFYKYFLELNRIDFTRYNSKKWLPDECFVNLETNMVYIIEKKFQNCAGSVDEKLPNCDFKKKEYKKLCHPIGFNVEYLYVFNNWFMHSVYRDTLEYIEDVGCYYFYNEIPLDFLGL
jgi:hypothetical protein